MPQARWASTARWSSAWKAAASGAAYIARRYATAWVLLSNGCMHTVTSFVKPSVALPPVCRI